MLKQESLVVVADNTQAKKAKIIRIVKWSTAKTAGIWDMVVVAVKEATHTASVKKWQVVPAVIVNFFAPSTAESELNKTPPFVPFAVSLRLCS